MLPVDSAGGAGAAGGGHTGVTRGRGTNTQVTRASAKSGMRQSVHSGLSIRESMFRPLQVIVEGFIW